MSAILNEDRLRRITETTILNDERLLRVTEVCKFTSMSRSGVYGLMDRGLLSYVKLGKSRRIPMSALEKLVRESTVGGAVAE